MLQTQQLCAYDCLIDMHNSCNICADTELSIACLCSWRPRLPSPLTADREVEIMKNLKQFTKK